MRFVSRHAISLLALTACLALPSGVLGEDPKPAPDSKPVGDARKRPDVASPDRVEAMRKQRETRMKELGLTEDQLAKLREINRAQADQIRALRSNTSLSAEDRRAKMKEITASTNAKLKSILTEEQYAKFTRAQEQRRNAGGRPGGSGGEGRGSRGETKPDAQKSDK